MGLREFLFLSKTLTCLSADEKVSIAIKILKIQENW